MSDYERLRLLIGDPAGFVHLGGLAAFGAFLVVLTVVMLASFVVALIFSGACRGRDDIYAVPPQYRRRGVPR